MSSPYDDNGVTALPNDCNYHDDSSDNDMDWEEVQVLEQEPQEQQPLMKIVLKPDDEAGEPSKKKSNTMSHTERMLRLDCHKIHTILLLVNARIRNKWLNDELLHARLLSLTPLAFQNAFAMIHSSKVPEAALRGRMFENSILRLAEWWSQNFFKVTEEGHIRNITFDAMKERLAKFVPGFTEQFEAAVAPLEPYTDVDRLRSKGKGKEREKQSIFPSRPLIDSSDLDLLEDILDNSLESIKSPKSLMKHALIQTGSRDTSSQLFTALCRALAIPTRLVVSLQSVPWKAAVGRVAKKYSKNVNGGRGKGKGKGQDREEVQSEDAACVTSSSVDAGFSSTGQGLRLDGEPIEKSEKAKGKEKAKPSVKLRKAKSKVNVLGGATRTVNKHKKVKHDDPRSTPPTYWTEVFSKADSRWIPVDPIRGYVNKKHAFDPSPSPSSSAFSSSGDNRLVYVIAFEEDGYARDVTRRYAREFGAKVVKVQGGSTTTTNRARVQWWQRVLGHVTRPFRLNRDDIEDDEFETAQFMEGMPTSITGFKDHPLYVLSRHLKQNETIYPPPAPSLETGSGSATSRSRHGSCSYTPELGKFRGEPVYPRSSVILLKTPENWLRSEGRSIKEGEVPMKYVKLRASTIGRKREIEMIKEGMNESTKLQGLSGAIGINVEELDSEDRTGASGSASLKGEVMQGLYARNQTELYVPNPVIDGIVPKNQFGNIDLYVKTMLPRGAVHMPFKGVAKIARKLRLDFAEAVTGFEFRKRRAMPVLEGIVVAQENEELVLHAFLEAEHEASVKARLKKEERVLKQWIRLVHGLRIRQRLQEQYVYRSKPQGVSGVMDTNASTTHSASGTKDKKGGILTSEDNKEDNKRNEKESVGFSHNKDQYKRQEEQECQNHSQSGDNHNQLVSGAGFLVQAGDVIQPFRLPRLPKLDSDLVSDSALGLLYSSDSSYDTAAPNSAFPAPDFETYDVDVPMDLDRDMDNNLILALQPTTPKTMHELAQADAVRAITPADNTNIHDQAQFESRSETVSMVAARNLPEIPLTDGSEPVVLPTPNSERNGKGENHTINEASLRLSANRRSARLLTRKRKNWQEDPDNDASDSDQPKNNTDRSSASRAKRSRQSARTRSPKAGASLSTRVLRPPVTKLKVRQQGE